MQPTDIANCDNHVDYVMIMIWEDEGEPGRMGLEAARGRLQHPL